MTEKRQEFMERLRKIEGEDRFTAARVESEYLSREEAKKAKIYARVEKNIDSNIDANIMRCSPETRKNFEEARRENEEAKAALRTGEVLSGADAVFAATNTSGRLREKLGDAEAKCREEIR